MDEIGKLKVLMPHLIEHGNEHIKSYKSWAEKLASYGMHTEAAAFERAGRLCTEALDELKSIKI